MKQVFHNQLIAENTELCQTKKFLMQDLKKIYQFASLKKWEIQYYIIEFSLRRVPPGARVLWTKH